MSCEIPWDEDENLMEDVFRKEVQITVDLKLGQAGAEWLGCDLSRQYIAINSDYTT